ncbi:MAG TPA: 50S ribosomal protein L11 methyltransferase [Oculatellaceae cyanobacterium]
MNESATKRKWATLEFEISAEHEDMASWLMIHNGATGCEVKQAGECRLLLQATFPSAAISDDELKRLESAMEEYGLSSSLRSLKVSQVEEQDWLERWKQGFQPFTIGKKLGICPPWLKSEFEAGAYPELAGRHVIFIEPGMAFGTGLHATTQYCMSAIEREQTIEEALDVGTGSGILAIAATILNPSCRVLAIDNDPESVRTSKHNCELNGVSARVQNELGTTEIVTERQYKHIFSNMTCEDIIALLPEYERLLIPGGVVFCAGVLTEKLHLLEDALASRGWKILQTEQNGAWTGLTVSR